VNLIFVNIGQSKACFACVFVCGFRGASESMAVFGNVGIKIENLLCNIVLH
jgi:hypothetical protein